MSGSLLTAAEQPPFSLDTITAPRPAPDSAGGVNVAAVAANLITGSFSAEYVVMEAAVGPEQAGSFHNRALQAADDTSEAVPGYEFLDTIGKKVAADAGSHPALNELLVRSTPSEAHGLGAIATATYLGSYLAYSREEATDALADELLTVAQEFKDNGHDSAYREEDRSALLADASRLAADTVHRGSVARGFTDDIEISVAELPLREAAAHAEEYWQGQNSNVGSSNVLDGGVFGGADTQAEAVDYTEQMELLERSSPFAYLVAKAVETDEVRPAETPLAAFQRGAHRAAAYVAHLTSITGQTTRAE